MKQPPQLTGEEAFLFTDKNISSITGQQQLREDLRHRRLAATYDTLFARRHDLNTIMTVTGLTAANLSSILTMSGTHLDEHITLLYNYRHDIAKVTQGGVLGPENFSSVAHKAGTRLDAVLAALTSPRTVELLEAITEHTFSQDNAAYLIGGAGKSDIERTLSAAKKQLPKLDAICARFKPSQVVSHLRNVAPEQMEKEIVRLYDTVLPLLDRPRNMVTDAKHDRPLSLKTALEMQRRA